jgi:uncharacterized protein (TIGR03437 family)
MKSIQTALGLMLAATIGITPGVTPAAAQQYNISTVAGIGTVQGYSGDTYAATSATLDVPTRVAVDSSGNIYIVDYYNFAIREVTAATGIINTIGGDGVESAPAALSGGTVSLGDNGPATQANISDVHGIAVDSSGNVYLADTGNARIREIVLKTGNMITFAGNGVVGYAGDGGAAVNASLSRPCGLAFDASGNLYVADYGNATVRKITPSGTISTIAGNGAYGYTGDGGPASKAQFGDPYAIAFDPAGNIFVSDVAFMNIREITTNGNIQTIDSNVDVESLVVDSADNIYYPDYVANTIQKLLPDQAQVTIAGNGTAGFSGDGGAATEAQLNQPYGVAFGSGGDIYIADSQNMVIRELVPVTSSIGIVNAASNIGGGVSPGEIVVLYGTGIGPSTLAINQPANGFFGTQVGGTTVSFDGNPAPLIYASATQVAAIVPYEEAIGATAHVSVTYQGQTLTTTIPVVATLPGFFTVGSIGSGQAAAVNQYGTLNNVNNPVYVGDYISLYATGEGQTSPAGVDGKIASTTAGAVLPAPLLQVTATVAGQQAVVSYAGAAPGNVAGLMQLNLQIPILGIQSGAPPIAVPVTMLVNGLPSQTAVSIYVAAH